MKLCGQLGCAQPARYLYHWPGEPEQLAICERHVGQLRLVAGGLGLSAEIRDIESPEELAVRAVRRLAGRPYP